MSDEKKRTLKASAQVLIELPHDWTFGVQMECPSCRVRLMVRDTGTKILTEVVEMLNEHNCKGY